MKRLLRKRLFVTSFLGLCTTQSFAAPISGLFPHEAIYPVYIADPLRPTFNAQYQRYSNSTIAGTGKNRFDLKLGANLPVYQTVLFQQAWQFVLIGGFHGQFDNEHSLDNIGWDGIYGFNMTTRQNNQLSWRFGFKHISAHIGDELIERTGRTRIAYTRQEARLGLAWQPKDSTTLYTEAGYAYDLRNEILQRPWRLQLGAQFQDPATFRRTQFHWYSALDLSAYQENNWDINTTIQVGIATASANHHWRIGLEFYNGRSQLGEFFQDRERYASLGLWFDL